MTIGALVVTPNHAAAVAEAEQLQQAYSDLPGQYEILE